MRRPTATRPGAARRSAAGSATPAAASRSIAPAATPVSAVTASRRPRFEGSRPPSGTRRRGRLRRQGRAAAVAHGRLGQRAARAAASTSSSRRSSPIRGSRRCLCRRTATCSSTSKGTPSRRTVGLSACSASRTAPATTTRRGHSTRRASSARSSASSALFKALTAGLPVDDAVLGVDPPGGLPACHSTPVLGGGRNDGRWRGRRPELPPPADDRGRRDGQNAERCVPLGPGSSP